MPADAGVSVILPRVPSAHQSNLYSLPSILVIVNTVHAKRVLRARKGPPKQLCVDQLNGTRIDVKCCSLWPPGTR